MRKIIHIDMDCFYAAIEMRDDPSLRGRPVAVGGDPNRRGVIATANYVARKFGVHSAMASARARSLCPDLTILPTRMDLYRRESKLIRAIFDRYTEHIEPLSLDEAYLDVTDSQHFEGSATWIAESIRRDIQEELDLTASAGVAPNKFLAKVASDLDKPNGLTAIPPDTVDDFIPSLPVEAIPGVGRVTTRTMHRLGLKTCADLQELTLEELWRQFGKRGRRLYDLCRGIDHRPLKVERIPKSVSVENTYSEDLTDPDACVAQIPSLLDELQRRYQARDNAPPIKALFVKVKFADFRLTTLERSAFQNPNPDAYEALLRKALQRHDEAVRLLGLGLRLDPERLDGPRQLDLFR